MFCQCHKNLYCQVHSGPIKKKGVQTPTDVSNGYERGRDLHMPPARHDKCMCSRNLFCIIHSNSNEPPSGPLVPREKPHVFIHAVQEPLHYEKPVPKVDPFANCVMYQNCLVTMADGDDLVKEYRGKAPSKTDEWYSTAEKSPAKDQKDDDDTPADAPTARQQATSLSATREAEILADPGCSIDFCTRTESRQEQMDKLRQCLLGVGDKKAYKAYYVMLTTFPPDVLHVHAHAKDGELLVYYDVIVP